jgi:hypothetical protein
VIVIGARRERETILRSRRWARGRSRYSLERAGERSHDRR